MWFYLVVSLVTLIYIWQRRKFSYFKNRGIPEDPGYFPFGSWGTWQMFMGKVALINGIGSLLCGLLTPTLLNISWWAAAFATPVILTATALPFFLLLFKTFLPLKVAFLALKPCVLALLILLG